MTDTAATPPVKLYARGLHLDPHQLRRVKTLRDYASVWSEPTLPLDLTGGLTDPGMGDNGPDPTCTIPGGPFGNCGPNAGPKNIDQMTAAMLGEALPAPWTSDRVVRLYFLYEAMANNVSWRPPQVGQTWTATDQEMAKQLDQGVEPVAFLDWLCCHDEQGHLVKVGEGLIEAYIKVTPGELEPAAGMCKAVMCAVNLNPQADAQFSAWQEGTNPTGWDIGPDDMPDPDDGHFIVLAGIESHSGPYKWGSWGAFVPSTLQWRTACVQVCFGVLTRADALAAGFPFDTICAEIAERGGTVPAVMPPPLPTPPPPSPGRPPIPPKPDVPSTDLPDWWVAFKERVREYEADFEKWLQDEGHQAPPPAVPELNAEAKP